MTCYIPYILIFLKGVLLVMEHNIRSKLLDVEHLRFVLPNPCTHLQVGGKAEELKGNVREHTTGLFSDEEKAKGKGQAAKGQAEHDTAQVGLLLQKLRSSLPDAVFFRLALLCPVVHMQAAADLV